MRKYRKRKNREWLPQEEEELLKLASESTNSTPDKWEKIAFDLNRDKDDVKTRFENIKAGKKRKYFENITPKEWNWTERDLRILRNAMDRTKKRDDLFFTHFAEKLNKRPIVVALKTRELNNIKLEKQDLVMKHFKDEYENPVSYEVCPICRENTKETTDFECESCREHFEQFAKANLLLGLVVGMIK